MVMFMRKFFIISLVISLYFTVLPAFAAYQLPFDQTKTFPTVQAAAEYYANLLGGTSCKADGNRFKIYRVKSISDPSFVIQQETYLDNKCQVFSSKGDISVTLIVVDDPTTCEASKGQTGKVGWNSYFWGSVTPSRYICSSAYGGCVALTGDHLCINIDPEALKNDPSLYDCDALYIVQDTPCSPSGDYPFCTDENCSSFLPEPNPNPNPEPEPEPEPQPEPEHNPSDPTAPLPDSGGEVINPSVPPKPPTEEKPKPDVETPDPTPDSNSDVVQSVTGMNEDMNELLTRLNSDNNKQLDDVNNQLLQLNTQSQRIVAQIAKQEKQDAAIYENTKALIQNLNKDVTTAVNKTTNAVNALGSKVDGLSDAVDGLGEDVSAIKDAITNVDTSGAGISGTCIESDTCTGFYESGYPDGISGIFSQHFETVSESVTDTVKDFMKIDLSHAQRPSFSIPVLHFGNFNFDDYINLDWIFGFVRVCMMVSTAFLCRKIIFGG
ncbi:attachment protein [Vibrio phage VP24-2_Ke]|uniref:Attachment protein n=1 Tax=Vibrio phage VP24-2_Ke TaxID=2652757 RepID=A0A649YJG8_9VIRU|nr:attachment protein [Vibrio phage VP24-2_Ke]QGM12449.1 attachment protein [Vibrio phage VP24-2_Ke]